MNISAAVFMILSWLLVGSLSAYCFVKVLGGDRERRNGGGR